MTFKLLIIFFSCICATTAFAQDNQDVDPVKDLGCLEHEGQANYWKCHWNTARCKGNIEQYI